MNMEDSVCIVDFAGNFKDCGFWYDYFPKHKGVKFGGILSDIPNMLVDHEPTEDECEAWIKDHTEFDYRSLGKLEVEIAIDTFTNDLGSIDRDGITEYLKIKLKEKRDETTEKIQG